MTVDFSQLNHAHVLQALAEHDELGAEAFLDTYGLGPARSHLLVHAGRTYDSEAVLGVAHRCATGTVATSDELPGGRDGAAQLLRELGFAVGGDATDVGSATARAAWAAAALPVLLEAARRYRAVVTYLQLAAAVQESTGITTSQVLPRWIGDVIGRVTDECQSRGEPLLSALCVNVQGSVGQGYADAVQQARGSRPDDPDEHAAIERLECYRHWQAAGLPSDGGTPLRTAHVTAARKAPVRASASRPAAAPRTRAPSSPKPTAAPKPAAKPAARPVALCPTCFTAVPASGVCDYCD